MIEIAGKKVVINETVLLKKGEDKVRFSGKNGLNVMVMFVNDGTNRPSIAPTFRDGSFQLPLANFGSTLGMAVSGSMVAQLSLTSLQAGDTWKLSYSLSVHLIGEEYRSLQLTISEEQLA